ncbi:hypothetical protein GALL_431630 [mine drainage metagenome]|uniref:DUF3105 domain-containing protein n=1 Tax=mine drainage metagenome TaxID=410659 RepID=A0A1J5QGR7_9ZZZZ
MAKRQAAKQTGRAEKLEEFRRTQEKANRNKRIGLFAGGTAVVVVIALIAFLATSGGSKAAPKNAVIAGVQTFPGLSTTHVNGPVKYAQTPPVGGDHSPVWLNCATYSQPVPNENAVHSLEHGAVWVTYDPTVVTGAQLDSLRKLIPQTYAILSPFPGLPAPIVASAWGVQLKVTSPTDPRISEFIAKYRESKSAPEPGSPCTGGIDGPGKLS